jgi:hypothetical protein
MSTDARFSMCDALLLACSSAGNTCFTRDHEVLVRDCGWTPIASVVAGSRVWSMRGVEEETAEWSLVTGAIRRDLAPKESLYLIASDRVNTLSTAEHVHWVRPRPRDAKTPPPWRKVRSDGVWSDDASFPVGAATATTHAWSLASMPFLPLDINVHRAKDAAWCRVIGLCLGCARLTYDAGERLVTYSEQHKCVTLQVDASTDAGIKSAAQLQSLLRTLGWLDDGALISTPDSPRFTPQLGGFSARSSALYDYLWPMLEHARSLSAAGPMPIRLAVSERAPSDVCATLHPNAGRAIAERWRSYEGKYGIEYKHPRWSALQAWRCQRVERMQSNESASALHLRQTEYAGLDVTVDELAALKVILLMHVVCAEDATPPWWQSTLSQSFYYPWRWSLSATQARGIISGWAIAEPGVNGPLVGYTSSIALREDLMLLAAMSGWQATIAAHRAAGACDDSDVIPSCTSAVCDAILWEVCFHTSDIDDYTCASTVVEGAPTLVDAEEHAQTEVYCIATEATNFFVRRIRACSCAKGTCAHQSIMPVFTGNCYLNSVVQALSLTDVFREYYVDAIPSLLPPLKHLEKHMLSSRAAKHKKKGKLTDDEEEEQDAPGADDADEEEDDDHWSLSRDFAALLGTIQKGQRIMFTPDHFLQTTWALYVYGNKDA